MVGLSGKDKDAFNGSPPHCRVSQDWDSTKEKAEAFMETATERLGDIAKAIQDSNTNLLGAATGRRQIPLEVVLALILLWGIYTVIILVKDSPKNIKLNWQDGLVITSGDKQ